MSNGGGEESCRTVGDVMVLSILPALGCLRAGQARIGFQKREDRSRAFVRGGYWKLVEERALRR